MLVTQDKKENKHSNKATEIEKGEEIKKKKKLDNSAEGERERENMKLL